MAGLSTVTRSSKDALRPAIWITILALGSMLAIGVLFSTYIPQLAAPTTINFQTIGVLFISTVGGVMVVAYIHLKPYVEATIGAFIATGISGVFYWYLAQAFTALIPITFAGLFVAIWGYKSINQKGGNI